MTGLLANPLHALLQGTDTNGDGFVNRGDKQCKTAIVGYSWGGVLANELAARYLHSPRVSPEKGLSALVLIDPFRPLSGPQLEVPKGVEHTWVYRHSKAPSFDCSANLPLGPYRGFSARGAGTTNYDFSLAGDALVGEGGMLRASDVSHCTVVDAAAAAVEHNVRTLEPAPELDVLFSTIGR